MDNLHQPNNSKSSTFTGDFLPWKQSRGSSLVVPALAAVKQISKLYAVDEPRCHGARKLPNGTDGAKKIFVGLSAHACLAPRSAAWFPLGAPVTLRREET